jgi:hypothetical protein
MPFDTSTQIQVAQIAEKLQQLPLERIMEVEDFIDFLKHRVEEGQLTKSAMITSEASFQRIWDNAEDAEYDRL